VNLSVESGTGPRFGVALPAALLHGIVTRRFTIDLEGAGRTTAAKFRPGGFRAYAGRQPARNTIVPLAGWLPPGARAPEAEALLRDVLAVDDDDDRAAVLDAALARHADDPAPAYLDLLALLGEMVEDRGLVRVEQVAARGRLTVRSLQRLFATYVGVGPKAVLARYRLQDAVAAIDAGEVTDLAALAAGLGWFDQAHFSRDFRAVVGTTPSAYLATARADAPERAVTSRAGASAGRRRG
jgi:AraC-like DNA-binding protein